MMLTGRSYGILLALTLLGIAGQWSAAVDDRVWLAAAGAWLIGLGAEFLGSRRRSVPIERLLPDRAYLGESFPARLRVHNPFPYTLALDAAEDLPEALGADDDERRLKVAPRGDAQTHLTLTPRRLGRVEWSALYTRVLGAFGLAWWYRHRRLPASIEVAPQYMSRMQLRRGSAEIGRYARPSPGSGSELFGFRDYVPGDPLRAIDWKATARRDRPIVRLQERDEHLELYLLIDVGRTSGIQSAALTRLHHYVNAAARLAQRALYQGDHVGLLLFADTPLLRVASVAGERGLLELRGALARARTQDRESNPLAAALQLSRMAQLRSLVVLLTDVDEPAVAHQLLHATRFLTPKHQPLIAGVMDEEVLDMRWEAALRWEDPYRSLAALELVREAKRTVSRLQRSGAKVVLTRPEALDARVIRLYDELRRMRRV